MVRMIDWLSMDSVTPKTEATKEQTLELLIAISQSVPRMHLTSNPSPMNSTIVNMARERENEDAEKYRSKLISISYTQLQNGLRTSTAASFIIPRNSSLISPKPTCSSRSIFSSPTSLLFAFFRQPSTMSVSPPSSHTAATESKHPHSRSSGRMPISVAVSNTLTASPILLAFPRHWIKQVQLITFSSTPFSSISSNIFTALSGFPPLPYILIIAV
ncbi:hypothetical protein C4D60_Mb11t00060 [Musa balbisiana]|uniref:Uncharacterized protein n=1 Tax=Musa balbisiana TaxID=52838 RepID=A0A4S8J0J2_MUSBA|nr:hypothetical protein C4D60_Mb11t00060 [Musa balbisiana]